MQKQVSISFGIFRNGPRRVAGGGGRMGGEVEGVEGGGAGEVGGSAVRGAPPHLQQLLLDPKRLSRSLLVS